MPAPGRYADISLLHGVICVHHNSPEQVPTVVAFFGYHYVRNEVTVAFEGLGEGVKHPRFKRSRVSETHIEAMQIEFQCFRGRGIRGANATRTNREWLDIP